MCNLWMGWVMMNIPRLSVNFLKPFGGFTQSQASLFVFLRFFIFLNYYYGNGLYISVTTIVIMRPSGDTIHGHLEPPGG